MIVRSQDGTLIFCESYHSPKARGALLVVHGLGEHSGRYDELVEHALKLRLDVHLMDLRGHGRSTGVRGHFTDISQHHQDIDAWIAHLIAVNALREDLPCLLLGHSLGGLIALTFAAKYVRQPLAPALSGLVLSAPLLGLRLNPMKKFEAQLARNIPKFLQTLHVPNGVAAADLSHDKEEVERYLGDPLVHSWITPGAFLAIENALGTLPKLPASLGLPVLFLLSGKDRVVHTPAAQAFAAKLGIAHPGQVEVKLFHSFFHEPFHELKRERAFLELKKWILKCLKTGSSPNPVKKGSSRSSGKGATARGTLP